MPDEGYFGVTLPAGWDIADAIAGSDSAPPMDAAALLAFMRARAFVIDADWIEKRKETEKGATPHDDGAAPESGEETPNEGEAKNGTGDRPGQALSASLSPSATLHIFPGSAPLLPPTVDWRAKLLYSDEHKLVPKSIENAILLVSNHDYCSGTFAWNDFASDIYVQKKPRWANGHDISPYPRPVQDNDVTSCRGTLERLNMRPTQNDTGQAIAVAAKEHRYNPVSDYFDALVWDGIPRVAGGLWEGEEVTPWLAEYLGAADTNINRAFGMRWLISGVARAYNPGTQVRAMLILEGDQNIGKSKAFKIMGTLGGSSYFTDDLQDLHSKDGRQLLHGKLIVEIAELASFGKAQVEQIKAFISREIDYFRPPYAKTTQPFPRSCIFGGSINPGHSGYLRDATGATRFWPVKMQRIDDARLAKDQPQLWAEAVHLWKVGEQHWLTEEETKLAAPIWSDRQERHPWATIIDREVVGLVSVRVSHVLTEVLKVPIDRQTALTKKMVEDMLGTLGYRRRGVDEFALVREEQF